MTTQNVLRFSENGVIREIRSKIAKLKKENSGEFLYTLDGHRIPLDDLMSINGIGWA